MRGKKDVGWKQGEENSWSIMTYIQVPFLTPLTGLPIKTYWLWTHMHVHTDKLTFFIESLTGATEVQKCPESFKALDTFPTLSSFGTCPRLARSGPLLSNSWLSHCCELFVSALSPLRVSLSPCLCCSFLSLFFFLIFIWQLCAVAWAGMSQR